MATNAVAVVAMMLAAGLAAKPVWGEFASAQPSGKKLSTEDIHALDPKETNPFMAEDPFRESRQGLDYGYHKHYSFARQTLQNSIVEAYLAQGRSAERPWLIFTAGPMGSGKTHTIKSKDFQEFWRFEYSEFIHLDPDHIKYRLPEMARFVAEEPTSAGTRTHKESGYIQELVFAEALKQKKNLIVDGSFKNIQWHRDLIEKLRLDRAAYRLGLVYVTADPTYLAKRLEKRFQQTQRYVSLEQALAYQQDIHKSVEALAGLFDFALWLTNHECLTLQQAWP